MQAPFDCGALAVGRDELGELARGGKNAWVADFFGTAGIPEIARISCDCKKRHAAGGWVGKMDTSVWPHVRGYVEGGHSVFHHDLTYVLTYVSTYVFICIFTYVLHVF